MLRASPLGIGPGVHLSEPPTEPLHQSDAENTADAGCINEAGVHGWSAVGNECFSTSRQASSASGASDSKKQSCVVLLDCQGV